MVHDVTSKKELVTDLHRWFKACLYDSDCLPARKSFKSLSLFQFHLWHQQPPSSSASSVYICGRLPAENFLLFSYWSMSEGTLCVLSGKRFPRGPRCAVGWSWLLHTTTDKQSVAMHDALIVLNSPNSLIPLSQNIIGSDIMKFGPSITSPSAMALMSQGLPTLWTPHWSIMEHFASGKHFSVSDLTDPVTSSTVNLFVGFPKANSKLCR